MLPDLTTEHDITTLVTRFYAEVAQDDILGPIFNDVAEVDWADHVPRLISFWSRMLLGVEGYHGNPMQKHADVSRSEPFTAVHFERWLELFVSNVDAGWSGDAARSAKTLAGRVALAHHTQLRGSTATDTELVPLVCALIPEICADVR